MLLAWTMVSAQAETVTGRVTNGKGEAMPYVTISVLDRDSALLTGAITDEKGLYIVTVTGDGLPVTELILQASFVGYKTVFGGPDFVLDEETEQLRRWR